MERRQQLGSKRIISTLSKKGGKVQGPLEKLDIIKKGLPSSSFHATKDIRLRTMYGIGDTLFQIPLIKEIARHYDNVWVNTVFPEALWEMPQNVHLIPSVCGIRTQKKYIASRKLQEWYEPHLFQELECPKKTRKVGLKYRARNILLNNYTVFDSFMHFMERDGIEFDRNRPLDFTLNLREAWADAARRLRREIGLVGKFAVARSVTYRTECMFLQRNCDHKHMQTSVDYLNNLGIPVIEVADVDDRVEFFVKEPLSNIHTHLIRGEVPLPVLMALVDQAAVTVTPTGMMYHIGQILRAPMVVLFGGMHSNYYFEHPSFNTPSVKCVLPEPFCNCWLSNCTTCNKHIDNERIYGAIDKALNR